MAATINWWGSSYLISSFPVSQSHYRFVEDLTKGLNADEKAVFKHVFATTLNSYRRFAGGLVPLPWRLLRAEARSANMNRLVDAGLLEMDEHSQAEHRCRRYCLSRSVLVEFGSSCLLSTLDHVDVQVDLFTGEPVRAARKSPLYDENRNAYPPVIQNSLKVLREGLCDEAAILAHLRSLKLAADEAEQMGEDAHKSAMGRYLSDYYCYTSGIKGVYNYSQSGLLAYKLIYNVQATGRIGQVGGGLQNASRVMKHAAYSNVPNMHNYDFVASQAAILNYVLERESTPCPFLKEYLEDPQSKYVYATKVGLSVDAWKKVFCATIFGAALTRKLKPSRAIGRVVLQDGSDGVIDVYRAVYEALRPLSLAMNKWHALELDRYNSYRSQNRGGFPRNAAGMPMNVDHRTSTSARKRLLAAYVLQGYEAYATHTLTTMGSSYGFTPISNEHDGLVTIGEIPEEAIRSLRKKTGLPFLQQKEKSIL